MIELVWPWALLAAPLPLLVRWLAAPRERLPDALTVPDLARFRGTDATTVQPGSARYRLRLALLWLAWRWAVRLCSPAAPLPGSCSEPTPTSLPAIPPRPIGSCAPSSIP